MTKHLTGISEISEEMQSHYIDPSKMEWAATPFAGIKMKVLYADKSSGMSTVLFQMEPGAIVPFHEHTGLEQTYMLEGSLEDEEGKAYPGSYVWRPGGSRHVAVAPNGATFLSMFMSPNNFFTGEKYNLGQ
jgi:anti-sigma factor ChrR (cupin superfamily)